MISKEDEGFKEVFFEDGVRALARENEEDNTTTAVVVIDGIRFAPSVAHSMLLLRYALRHEALAERSTVALEKIAEALSGDEGTRSAARSLDVLADRGGRG